MLELNAPRLPDTFGSALCYIDYPQVCRTSVLRFALQ